MIGKVSADAGIHNNALRTDAVGDNQSKSIQNELKIEERRLNRLQSDSKMSQEEKTKARQEIQQKIAELNRQLKLEQMEKEKEAEEAAREQESEAVVQEEKAQKDEIATKKGEEIHQMLFADASLQQERVLNHVSRKQEGLQNVLQAEIKSDRLYGTDTEAKEEQLEKMRQKERLFIEPWQPEVKQEQNDKMANAKIVISDGTIV